MALSETARLIASLELKDQFTPTANKALKSVDRLDAGITRASSRSHRAGQQIGTGIKNGALIAASGIGFLISQVGFGLKSLAALESETKQTNAVLASTKGVSGQTADSIRNLAEKYENLNAIIDDKVIQSAENVLLTFTAIRKDAFEPTLAAALDLSTAMGQDLQSSVVQVGKALQDPIRGVTALRRVGVNFSQDQVKVIKRLVETGRAAEAQRLILKELNTEFGGSFKAAGTSAEGTLAGIGDAVEDLQKALATGLFPILQKVLPRIRGALADPAVIKGAKDMGDAIASLFSDENLATGADFLKGAFETAKQAAPVIKDAASATFSLVKGAVSLFRSLPPELQKLAVGAFAVNKLTGGLVTNIAGGIIDIVGKQFLQRGGTPANPLFVSDVTGGAGALGGTAGGTSKLGKVASAVGKVFIAGAAIGVFAELKGILDEQTNRNKAQATDLTSQTQGFVKVAGIEDMKRGLANIEAEERRLRQTVSGESLAFNLNIDGVRDAVEGQRKALVTAIANAEAKSASAQVIATERSEAIASQKADAVRAATLLAARRVQQVEIAENRAANRITARINAARAAGIATGATAVRALGSIREKVESAKRAQVAATFSANHRTAQAIRNKRLAVTIPVTNNISVSGRDVTRNQTTFRLLGGTIRS